jgi:hypothetical protein
LLYSLFVSFFVYKLKVLVTLLICFGVYKVISRILALVFSVKENFEGALRWLAATVLRVKIAQLRQVIPTIQAL